MLRKRAIALRHLRADTDPDDLKVSAVCALACALVLGALIVADKTVMADTWTDTGHERIACAAPIGQQASAFGPYGPRALECRER
jgi:hypothetical protein